MSLSDLSLSRRVLIAALLVGGLSGLVGRASYAQDASETQEPCPVEGAWVMESQTADGETLSMEQPPRKKVVTDSHWAWVDQENFGGGTYEVTDSTYTEHIEYFHAPPYVGLSLTYSCRVEGDRWYIEGEIPTFEDGQQTGSVQIEEVWRRAEAAGQTGREE